MVLLYVNALCSLDCHQCSKKMLLPYGQNRRYHVMLIGYAIEGWRGDAACLLATGRTYEPVLPRKRQIGNVRDISLLQVTDLFAIAHAIAHNWTTTVSLLHRGSLDTYDKLNTGSTP